MDIIRHGMNMYDSVDERDTQNIRRLCREES